MNEKRRLPRKRPDVALHVTDTMTGEVVGHLGNLSMEGMLLLAQRPIADDALYQFSFHLPDAHGRLYPIEVGVHEQWSAPGTMRGQSWVGFRFIDIAPDDATVLRDWLMHAQDFVD
ncbi:MAG TPA: PilZ domain-containing protein [Dokdonella sp.]|nr:PilZ domain-containing protein [Dokdonella sp.]